MTVNAHALIPADRKKQLSYAIETSRNFLVHTQVSSPRYIFPCLQSSLPALPVYNLSPGQPKPVCEINDCRTIASFNVPMKPTASPGLFLSAKEASTSVGRPNPVLTARLPSHSSKSSFLLGLVLARSQGEQLLNARRFFSTAPTPRAPLSTALRPSELLSFPFTTLTGPTAFDVLKPSLASCAISLAHLTSRISTHVFNRTVFFVVVALISWALCIFTSALLSPSCPNPLNGKGRDVDRRPESFVEKLFLSVL
jgi:hypothetical protein